MIQPEELVIENFSHIYKCKFWTLRINNLNIFGNVYEEQFEGKPYHVYLGQTTSLPAATLEEGFDLIRAMYVIRELTKP